MKSILLSSIILLSPCFAEESFESHDYSSAWRDIYSEEYGLACYHLKDIDISQPEDELHVLLMKLLIAVKRGKTSTQFDIVEQIEELVEDEYVR